MFDARSDYTYNYPESPGFANLKANSDGINQIITFYFYYYCCYITFANNVCR